jgi:hypothetical protein
VSAVDWHHPQWLAIAILIVAFSSADALLTLMLIERGAYEANPLMAPLVGGSALAFALVKVGLTAGGVVLLIGARIGPFSRIPVEPSSYHTTGAVRALIAYEFSLLDAPERLGCARRPGLCVKHCPAAPFPHAGTAACGSAGSLAHDGTCAIRERRRALAAVLRAVSARGSPRTAVRAAGAARQGRRGCRRRRLNTRRRPCRA